MSGPAILFDVQELAATRPGGDLLGPVSLKLFKGDCLALVGPAGSGREDLADLLTGQTRQRFGEIFLNGEDISALLPSARNAQGLGRCNVHQPTPSFRNLLDWLNLSSQIARVPPGRLWWRGLHTNDPAVQNDVASALEFCGLRSLAAEPLPSLSSNQLRWAHLASALIQRPKVLILERPFAGLERRYRENWTECLKLLCRDGLALIVIDDCPSWLADFCNHMAVMVHGRLIAQGSPDDVGQDPAAIEGLTGRRSLP